jgi:hypothetical protein
MDNLEHDGSLSPWTFLDRAGVYLPEFGVQSEVNMFVGGDAVTGQIQRDGAGLSLAALVRGGQEPDQG